MNKTTPSDNILKLRELTEKICNTNPDAQYELILKNLKNIVNVGKSEINISDTPQSKIKCYEQMCVTITNILNNVKF